MLVDWLIHAAVLAEAFMLVDWLIHAAVLAEAIS